MRVPTNFYFAQATQAPNSGASNAQDFQPPTRNPQTAPANLQPGTGKAQETSTQDILSQQNTRINITKNPAEPPQPVQPVNGGINWIFVSISTIVIVGVLYYLLGLRDRHKVTTVGTEAVTETPPMEAEPPVEKAPAAKPAPATKKKETSISKSTSKKSKKKKSKSKRKRR